MIQSGFYNLQMLVTLGSVEQEEVWNEELQVYLYTQGDQSVLLLLYGVATILLTLIMFWIWRGTLKSAYRAECFAKEGRHVNNFIEDIRSLFDENIYRLLMTPLSLLYHGPHRSAADLHDLHGIHQLQPDRQPSGAV